MKSYRASRSVEKPARRTPQRIACGLHGHASAQPIRMAHADVAVAIAIADAGCGSRAGLPIGRRLIGADMNVVADSLQPLQNGLPTVQSSLPQERPQSWMNGVFQERFAVGLRDEEPVQADVERLGDSSPAVPRLGVIWPLSMRDK